MDLGEFIQEYKFEGELELPSGKTDLSIQFTHYNPETLILRGISEDSRGESVIIANMMPTNDWMAYLCLRQTLATPNQAWKEAQFLMGKITNINNVISLINTKESIWKFDTQATPIDIPFSPGYMDRATQLKFYLFYSS